VAVNFTVKHTAPSLHEHFSFSYILRGVRFSDNLPSVNCSFEADYKLPPDHWKKQVPQFAVRYGLMLGQRHHSNLIAVVLFGG
jgi:hypothetical protein